MKKNMKIDLNELKFIERFKNRHKFTETSQNGVLL